MQVSITNNTSYNDLCLQNTQQQNMAQLKKYICSIENCNKRFDFKYLLKQHMLIHENKKKYTCSTCNKGFNTVGLLGQHKKIHEDKKYKCDTCNSYFGRKENLLRHAKTSSHKIDIKYLVDKKYQCSQCIKIFTSKRKIQKHYLEDHSSIKFFSCTACNKSYRYESHLKKHYEKTHDNKTKHKQIKNHKDNSLLETSNQKTISNNDNLNACQGNNQYNVFGLQCDTTLEIKKELNEDDDLFDLQQELNEDDLFDLQQELNEDDLFDLQQ